MVRGVLWGGSGKTKGMGTLVASFETLGGFRLFCRTIVRLCVCVCVLGECHHFLHNPHSLVCFCTAEERLRWTSGLVQCFERALSEIPEKGGCLIPHSYCAIVSEVFVLSVLDAMGWDGE